jgi:hypothetical protein
MKHLLQWPFKCLPMVQLARGTVVLEIPVGLRRLAAQLTGVTDLVSSGESLPQFDWHCPLMSLPLAFGTSLETIPAHVPYIPIPEDARHRAATHSWPAEGLRVGLVWAGNPMNNHDRYRSIPPSLLERLHNLNGVHLFSLQVGRTSGKATETGGAITDLASGMSDMADTAALLEQLDLIISVDTAVAHLAGALGIPVWLLLPFTADWRWLQAREDSPWYPTMRPFGRRSSVTGRRSLRRCTMPCAPLPRCLTVGSLKPTARYHSEIFSNKGL